MVDFNSHNALAALGNVTPVSAGTHDALIAMLFSEITAVANDLRKHEARLHREDHLPPGGLGILELLAQGSRTVPQLAHSRGTSRQNVQIIVNRLKGQKWVESIVNPAHRRCPLIAIRQEGRAVLAAAERRKQQECRLWEAGVSEANASMTLDTVRQLRNVLSGATESVVKPRPNPKRTAVTNPSVQDQPQTAPRPQPQPGLDYSSEAEGFPVNLL